MESGCETYRAAKTGNKFFRPVKDFDLRESIKRAPGNKFFTVELSCGHQKQVRGGTEVAFCPICEHNAAVRGAKR